MPELGRILIVLGIAIVVLGVLFTFGGRIPWLGNLPGDIHIQRGRFSLYFPITTCVVISAVISLVLYFFRR
jgi:formate hydrogenlyase subunit 3/multisubunit Na+/H+ antiporter MnhD subunit